MKKYLAVVLFILMAFPAYAGKSEISDFGCALELDITQESAIARIVIPDQVYECVTRQDLGDLRVFSPDGNVFPHTIKKPEYSQGEAPAPVELPFFPVYRDENHNGDISMRVETGAGGSIIDVKTGSGEKKSETEAPTSWLIDATSAEKPFSGLVVEWSGAVNLVFDVIIEAGDDLSRLRRISGPVTLADLDYGGHRLSRNRADIPLIKVKYLRLSWPNEAGGARISSIKAVFPKPGVQPEMKWKEVHGQKASAAMGAVSGKTVYEFDTNGVFPVERIEMQIPAGLGVLQGTLMSRPDLASNWRVRYTGTFYDLMVNGKTINGGQASIAYGTDRFWEFETSQESAFKNTAIPMLKIGWVPHELYFVPGSSKNCVLAFGKQGVTLPSDNAVDSLLSQLFKDSSFKPALAVVSNVKNHNRNPPVRSFPIRKWLLWGVLVLGVAVIGFMAYRLYRQMGDK
ncbi:DUF3999 domain-containing protein [Desulforegula conservatrix]|uniref:DUF3999 domain-containing protein n=1 Tax=Desulforegula conservatrix TaxID=153026 RepID=UPI0003FF2814|nr:DUF3999 domain-containing protein [Desulforegula conservatrix]